MDDNRPTFKEKAQALRDDGDAVSHENVEIVRAQYASFSRLAERDEIHSHVLGYFDPNCEYRPVEEIDAIRGHEALIEWIERWLEAWSSFRAEVEEIIDGGELVVAEVSTSGRGRTSGVEIRQRFFHVFEMREGRILREGEYLDRDSALEAAGLSE
jgi:ketosteroid isomerase-like protein